MEKAMLAGWLILMALGWAAVWWTEKVKTEYWSDLETDHYLDLSKDSRLAQERSLAALVEKPQQSLKDPNTDA